LRPPLCRPFLERLEARELPSTGPLSTDQVQAAYGQIPLSFEVNQGQTDPQVRFLSHGSGYALFLTPTEAVLRLQKPAAPAAGQATAEAAPGDVLRLQLLGANAAAAVVGEDQLPGTSNYFLGNDPRQWHPTLVT
jgi:hypothetical protein